MAPPQKLGALGLAVLWPDSLALAALSGIVLAVSVLRFEKSLH